MTAPRVVYDWKRLESINYATIDRWREWLDDVETLLKEEGAKKIEIYCEADSYGTIEFNCSYERIQTKKEIAAEEEAKKKTALNKKNAEIAQAVKLAKKHFGIDLSQEA